MSVAAWVVWTSERGRSFAGHIRARPPILLLRFECADNTLNYTALRHDSHGSKEIDVSNHKPTINNSALKVTCVTMTSLTETGQNPQYQRQGGGAGSRLERLLTNQIFIWLYYACYAFGVLL